VRILGLMAVVLLLTACQGTAFEKPPIADSPCDARLAGHWDSIGDKADEDGEVQLDVSDACDLAVFERKQGKILAGSPTRLHVGQLGDWRYLWVDAQWSKQRFDTGLPVRPGDIYLMRYQLRKGELVLNVPDDKLIAHRIIDGDIPGQVSKDDQNLQNRITGGPHPQLLDSPGFFRRDEMRFRRGEGSGKP